MDNLAETFQKLDAAVLLIDSEHRIQWMNNKAKDWFGGSRVGERRACYRTLAFGAGFCTVCPTGRTIDGGTPTHYEFTSPQKGEKRSFEVLALPVGDLNSPVSVLEVVIDVTERGVVRLKENEVMAQIEKMVAIGQLAAGVAHELNTPLGTISIISDELSRAFDRIAVKKSEGEVILEYLADMRGEVARCKTIIKDLLDFSKRGVSNFVKTDINALVSKTVDFINKGTIKHDIRISKFPDAALPAIMTDPDRFRQVLFNVIKNAIDALESEAGGELEISTQIEGCFVAVTVKDNGPGISEDNLKRIFEPFFTTKPVGKGTGLGLSVSYGIMRDIKGEIRVDSQVGSGTKVTLLLPIVY